MPNYVTAGRPVFGSVARNDICVDPPCESEEVEKREEEVRQALYHAFQVADATMLESGLATTVGLIPAMYLFPTAETRDAQDTPIVNFAKWLYRISSETIDPFCEWQHRNVWDRSGLRRMGRAMLQSSLRKMFITQFCTPGGGQVTTEFIKFVVNSCSPDVMHRLHNPADTLVNTADAHIRSLQGQVDCLFVNRVACFLETTVLKDPSVCPKTAIRRWVPALLWELFLTHVLLPSIEATQWCSLNE